MRRMARRCRMGWLHLVAQRNIMDCVAWYRSDLPGRTVPIG